MNMQAVNYVEEHEGTTTADIACMHHDGFVLRNTFEVLSTTALFNPPSSVTTTPDTLLYDDNDFSFPLIDLTSCIDIDEQDFALPSSSSSGIASVVSDIAATTDVVVERGSPFARITRMAFENMLTERLDRWSNGTHTNLNVECDPTSNLLQFLRGQFHCDAIVNLDRIVFGSIRVSGGQLQAKNFCLNLFSFAPMNVIPLTAPAPRYPNQFDLLAQNLTFTQEDLCESPCIRNGLKRILTRILKNRGLAALKISIRSIQVLPTGKVSCLGQATTLFGPPIQFEVRSGIGVASRGHILTFPGLEISVNPALGFFVPVIPDVTVDLGHNAQLLDVTIDGAKAQVQVSARVTITPEHTIQLKNYIQSSHSYGALCSVDVGQWLTRLGRFAY